MSDPIPSIKFGDCLAFHDPGFISWRIRGRTNGWSNHVAFATGQHFAWEATFGEGLWEAPLVPMLSRNLVLLRPQTTLGLDYSPSPDQCLAAQHLFDNEKGSKYDVTGIIGFLFLSYRNRWENPNGWFCSEWVNAVSESCGIKLFNGCADQGSLSPTAIANSVRYRPVWYRLPEKVSQYMRLEGVPHA